MSRATVTWASVRASESPSTASDYRLVVVQPSVPICLADQQAPDDLRPAVRRQVEGHDVIGRGGDGQGLVPGVQPRAGRRSGGLPVPVQRGQL